MKAQVMGRVASIERKAGVLMFSVAENYRAKKGEEWTKEVSFWPCLAWGKNADNIQRYFNKGDGIFVHGELILEKYEGKTYPKLKVAGFEFTPGKAHNDAKATPGPDPMVEDIPF